MKRKQILSLLLCLFALGAMAKKQLVILHTNDTHSCIMPLSENLADTAIAGRGGFLRRVEMMSGENIPICCISTAATSRRVRPTTRSLREMWK